MKGLIEFVTNKSYFDYEGENNGAFQFSTRKNGSVSSETASQIDVKAGMEIKSLVLKKFSGLDVLLEIVDEFVMIFISKEKKRTETFRYQFIKDSNGCGFTEGFGSMDELIKRFKNWIVVDWDSLKIKMESVDKFPNYSFCGYHISNRVLIKSAGEVGNDWGYNFYLQKTMEVKMI